MCLSVSCWMWMSSFYDLGLCHHPARSLPIAVVMAGQFRPRQAQQGRTAHANGAGRYDPVYTQRMISSPPSTGWAAPTAAYDEQRGQLSHMHGAKCCKYTFATQCSRNGHWCRIATFLHEACLVLLLMRGASSAVLRAPAPSDGWLAGSRPALDVPPGRHAAFHGAHTWPASRLHVQGGSQGDSV